jgi:large subunit ribosomal protein L17
MRRNLAQSLFQHGQIETTLIKAKEVRPFVEKLITLARRGTLRSRQRINSILSDRSMIEPDMQEQYDGMSDAHRTRVMRSRSGRLHRTGKVPASYNKKKIPFVAKSVVQKLITEIAPNYHDRAGGYTRIIRLAKRRIGDDSDLAILQLVGDEAAPTQGAKKAAGRRKKKIGDRMRLLEGKAPARRQKRSSGGAAAKSAAPAPKGKAEGSDQADQNPQS